MEQPSVGGGFESSIHQLDLPEDAARFFASDEVVATLATGQLREHVDLFVKPYRDDRTPDNLITIATQLMHASAHEAPDWGQNQRDASTTLAVALAEAGHNMYRTAADERLIAGYLDCVRGLPADGDYLSAPLSLHELGLGLASAIGETDDAILSYRTRMQVREAWSSYFSASSNQVSKEVGQPLVEDLTQSFLPLAAEQTTQTWEWSRAMPEMDERTRVLHDAYLNEVRAKGSFKLKLHELTPDFSAKLDAGGLPVERFWNLYEPARVAAALETALTDPDIQSVRARLAQAVAQECGVSLDELTKDPLRIRLMADQVQRAAERVQRELGQALDTSLALQHMRRQVLESRWADRPQRKLKPIHKFLQQVFDDASLKPDSKATLAYFDDPASRVKLLEYLQQRSSVRERAITRLSELFPKQFEHLRFMNRDENDLYAADDTRDCTAYHLECGFNGWTVPHWLCNPGFMMAYAVDGNRSIAKFGLLLARDNQQLRLVIDSIEVNKSYTEDGRFNRQEALFSINLAFKQLHAWAESRDLGDVLVCTYTNSSELTMELPVVKNPIQPQDLVAIGGGGLQEVWEGVANDSRPVSVGYLQSRKKGGDGEDAPIVYIADDDEIDDDMEAMVNEHLRQLEVHLMNAMSPELSAAARAGDLDTFFCAYVKKAAPLVYQIFGDSGGLYRKYVKDTSYIFGSVITAQSKELELVNEAMAGMTTLKMAYQGLRQLEGSAGNDPKLRRHIAIQDEAPLASPRLQRRAIEQSDQLDRLHNLFDVLSEWYRPATALQRIFGREEPLTSQEIAQSPEALETTWPILDRDAFMP